ncbi:hypothetical protein JL721_2045 [Aureococcus anophagefferens]|nr:hypothetical protein JL721_2045 [Aureococcus anophagefferens]
MTTQRAVRGSDLTLHVLGEHYEVVRLGPGAAIPADLFSSNPSSSLVSITRTADELSIIRPRGARRIDGEKLEAGWRALKVQGPLPFHLVGVLSHLSATLAAAGVSIFVNSTYDTDYVMVKDDKLHAAVDALKAGGSTAPEKKVKDKKKKERKAAAPLDNDAAALNDCFASYVPAPSPSRRRQAATSDSSSGGGLASVLPRRDDGEAAERPRRGPQGRVRVLVDTDAIVAPEPPRSSASPPPATGRGPRQPPAGKSTMTGDPVMVDNRFTQSSTKLAAGFGVCGNAPLGDVPAAPQIAPARPPQTASVGEAFGSAIDGC